MNLPGFTAEASVYQAVQPYRTRSSHDPAGLSNSVQAALAIYVDGRFICNGEVNEFGFINCGPIGGGGQVCRPACGRCLPDSESPTGRSKLCILRNCDDVQRAC